MKKCPYCAELIQDDARVCRFCGRGQPKEMFAIHRRGHRMALGERRDGLFAVWDQQSGTAIGVFPHDEEGWKQALGAFQSAESTAANAATAYSPSGVALGSVILGVVGAVIGFIPILSIFALACGAAGLILGLVSLSRARAAGTPRGMAYWGIGLSGLAILLAIVGIGIVNDAFDSLENL